MSAKPKRIRWECPAGEHPAVLGSRRPRAEAIVRFCLPCSQAAGHLVRRVAPALERERAAAAAKASAKRTAATERTKAAAAARLTVTLDDGDQARVDELLAGLCKLDVVRTARSASGKEAWGWPDLKLVRRARYAEGVGGAAWPTEYRMTINVGRPGPTSRERLEEVVLHKLVHCVLPERENHGDLFRFTLRKAAREWWPGIELPPNEGEVYAMCRAIVDAARALNGKT